jgi:hypothetical protein
MEKPPRTFWQIWNMSFGFLGIQFGWGLQMANVATLPSALLVSAGFARCKLGVLVSAGAAT